MQSFETEVLETETFECRQDRLETAVVFVLLLLVVLGAVAFGTGYYAGRADRAAAMEFCQ